ncbi:MAG: hypothetical protein ACRD88_20395 [Terriglobia bacterium]
MSVSSFPRAEHIALLRQAIEHWLRERKLPLEVAERGLHQLKCQYVFGFRHPRAVLPDQERPTDNWAELAIHFQMAQRLEEGRGETEIDALLDRFCSRLGDPR